MAQETSLPDGWKWVTLGSLGNYINGRAFKPSEWGITGRPIIRIQNLTGSSKTLNRYKGDVEEKYIIRDGDLLISWSATLGVFVYQGEEAVLNQHIFKVEPHVNKRFLYYLITAYLDTLKRQVHGSGMQHITKGKFDNSPVPLPPEKEQERIVAKIEELFTRLEAGTASLRRIQAQLKRYKASVLKAACEGRLVPQDPSDEPAEVLLRRLGKSPLIDRDLPGLPEGWCWVSWGQLISSSQNGFGKRNSDSGTPTIVIRLADIKEDNIVYGNVRRIKASEDEIGKYELCGKDLICIRVNGSLDNVGRMVLFHEYSEPVIFCDHFIRFRMLIPEIADFYSLYFNTERAREYIELNRVSSAGQNTISQSTLNKFLVPLPPIAAQRRIVAEVEQRLSVAAEMEKAVEAALARAARLRQSILKRAFEGRLLAGEPQAAQIENMMAETASQAASFQQARLI